MSIIAPFCNIDDFFLAYKASLAPHSLKDTRDRIFCDIQNSIDFEKPMWYLDCNIDTKERPLMPKLDRLQPIELCEIWGQTRRNTRRQM